MFINIFGCYFSAVTFVVMQLARAKVHKQKPAFYVFGLLFAQAIS